MPPDSRQEFGSSDPSAGNSTVNRKVLPMDLATKLNEKSLWRKYGSILHLVRKLLWIQKVNFYTLDLADWKQPSIPRMRLSVRFSFGNEGDVKRMADDPHLDVRIWEDNYLEKLRAGDRLLIGKIDEEVVFYIWVVTQRKELMDKVLILNPDEFAIERVFTRKEYRGYGLFMYGLNYLLPLLMAERKTSCLTEITTHNMPMVSTILKCGFLKTDSYYLWLSHQFGNLVFPRGTIAERCVYRNQSCVIST